MNSDSSDWSEAWTLEEYIVDLLKRNETKSVEFQALLRIYGREKIEKIYKKHFKSDIKRPSNE